MKGLNMIKTKIVCTLGPATDDPKVMEALVLGGMDVARMNFSHGSHAEHGQRLALLRETCKRTGISVPVLLDTKGPEIRTGSFKEKKAVLKDGQDIVITTRDIMCDTEYISVSYGGLSGDVSAGDRILIDDGLISLEVRKTEGTEIYCRVLNGGEVSDKKSVNVPGVPLGLPNMTEQDKSDILFGIENDYDFIAASFVRKSEDILDIRRLLNGNGGEGINLIAKIENREGIDNLDEIIRAADGIMVARGDLGVEIPVEEIPIAQKDMIRRCYRASKPVITATQMLDSMIRNPRPTRAEVNDVANAIYDGSSAIMLSGETASGKYPVESLQTMKNVAGLTEKSIHYWKRFSQRESTGVGGITNAISHATCMTALDLSAAAIIAVTTSGKTARRISGFRPECPIVAATTSEKVYRQLRLSWGVLPMHVDVVSSTDGLFSTAVDCALDSGLVNKGDIVVITAGVPVGMSGTTNMLKVQMIGDVLCRGRGFGSYTITAPVSIVCNDADKSAFSKGDILVTDELGEETLPLVRQAAAVILDGEDRNGQAATLAAAFEIPVITEAYGAVKLLKSGSTVSVDPSRGVVGNL